MATPAADVCPTCLRPFDGGKKRRLIDSCGHERCYSCMFNSEICSVCVAQAQTQRSSSRRTTISSDNSSHTRATLNQRSTGGTGRASGPPEIPPRLRLASASPGVLGPPPLPAKAKHVPQACVGHPRQQSPGHYSNQSLAASTQAGCKSPITMETWDLDREGDSPPPPPPDVAQHDLMMRLGLLLGDAIHPSGITGVGVVLPGNLQGEATLNSISSLSSNEHTPEKSASDASSMSTLTASSGGEVNMALPGPYIHPASCSPMDNQDGSSPHDLIFQRPHIFTTSVPGANEDTALFGSSRNTSGRRSARSSAIGRKYEPRTTKSDQLQLKPLVFEVPHPEGKPIFVGRAWLFSKLETVFGAGGGGAPDSNGVIITGGQGTGKTAIVEQLINHSCFSDDNTACNLAKPQDKHQSNQSHGAKLTDYTALNGLGFQVVAYHICQADNSATCMLADMVSSMAAQMAKAPQLVAYREFLLQEPHLQNILSITECTQNPSLSFLKGILEPLQMLKNAGKIFTDCCIILVDSLNEAEFHKPDHGDTIASFLCRHASKFPHWLKLVVTVQSSFQEITASLPLTRISLDQHGNNSDHVSRDIVSYIEHRISISSTIRANIAVNGRPNKELTAKFTSHVQSLSSGSFLYAKLVLDLIESGHLVPKSSSYTILPVNLSEVFLLHFNLKFSSIRAYERVSAILAVCLASLYPLTLVDIFLTVNSGYVHQYLSWEEFSLRMDMLAGFVYSCRDNTVMFFHPAFREWLIHRNEGDCSKFLCDPRHGHALLAFRLSRVSAPLTPDKTVELGHHILKAHIYKSVSRQLGYSSQNVQAYWMCLSSRSLNAALVSHRNVYSPNVKVSRLILLSGGNPNSRTEYLSNAPVLCVAAREGYIDMLSLLLEFGADPNLTSDTGMSPLCHGAAGGHVEVMRMLCLHNARPSAQDVQGNSAAIHAVIHGQLEAVKFLMHLNWTVQPNELTKDEVVTQCFVASAATGNTQILEYLHDTYNGSRLNTVDSLLSETALTAACLHGRTPCVKFLLDCGADITVPNARFFTPLLCAVKCGRWEVCDLLLASGADLDTTDQYGCTPLMMAAREGHTTVLTLLLEKGASQISTDRQGLTALCWACLRGHLSVVESLVTHGSNVNHLDVNGRSPLHLAAMYGDVSVVQFLIDHKAQIELTDLNGMRALDCAIVYNNIAVIICFLRKGAKLGPNTWSLATEKTDILLLLLNKLTEDGSILYKKNRIKEASQRYQYALKKLPTSVRAEEVQTFQELKLSFLLNLSRCKRRMNDLQSAVDLATKALEVRPRCFEAYYARARARRDNRQYAAAQQDLIEALQLAPKNKELQRLLTRVKEECWEQMARYESGGREMASLEMDRIAEDDNDSLIVDNPVLYLPAV
ncbi:hypothetical protein BsWGS_09368 [Bradybaena similaris]